MGKCVSGNPSETEPLLKDFGSNSDSGSNSCVKFFRSCKAYTIPTRAERYQLLLLLFGLSCGLLCTIAVFGTRANEDICDVASGAESQPEEGNPCSATFPTANPDQVAKIQALAEDVQGIISEVGFSVGGIACLLIAFVNMAFLVMAKRCYDWLSKSSSDDAIGLEEGGINYSI